MYIKFILSLFTLIVTINCTCPAGYKFAANHGEWFSLPEANVVYQAAMICIDTGSYTTMMYERQEGGQILCR